MIIISVHGEVLLNYYLQPLQQPQNRARGPRLVLISI